ncbi:MAG: phosphoribosylformylglycinamidine synthase subunit PurL [Deltaproteobacteria bacterium]|nr:phosphoribosylformylglycinamidine synthase subunit PurL [Deltaproteobacteria bacterium]
MSDATSPDTAPVTPETVRAHGLTDHEYAEIVRLLGRAPNLTELGVFSVMWSEHCSYKSSRKHLKQLPTEGPRVIHGPGENAGVMDIGDGLAVVFKIESHNHPSFIEPYQGAATGVGGILRDVFTMGARPIASLNSLRFGGARHPKTPYLVNGVVGGIGGYGNCVGVPTVGGDIYFDECYDANILVNAFTLGLAERDRIFTGKARGAGNPVVYVGSKTGRDGVHGATMASESFSEDSEQRRPTVQVGDPFTEKLLIEACLELMRTDAIVGIQDMGAAGLTSSAVEMAGRAGSGVELELARVPLRERGMTPYEILLSESQERMLLVAHPESVAEVRAIFQRWDLDAVVVGRVIDEPVFRVLSAGRPVADIPVAALTDAAPAYDRPAKRPPRQDELQRLDADALPRPESITRVLEQLLDSPNLASREWVYRQYDHYVRGNTVLAPGADAAVIRVKGTSKGLALTVDCNARYCYLDPHAGGMAAVAEAARNLACVGATPLGLTDCLNFGNPEREDVMWQFSQAIQGMREACLALEVPVVSGNVSFYNETDGVSIHPTPTVAMVGLLEDVTRIATPWFKEEGDLVVLLGLNRDELGGSEYLKVVHGQVVGKPPVVDLALERGVQRTCRSAVEQGLLSSAHDVSEGGLAVALADCCISHPDPEGIGAVIEIEQRGRADALLFGESHSRIVVSLKERDYGRLQDIANRENVAMALIGKVDGDRLAINDLVRAPVQRLRNIWSTALERYVK